MHLEKKDLKDLSSTLDKKIKEQEKYNEEEYLDYAYWEQVKNNAEAVKKKLSETQPDFAIRLKEQKIIKEES